MKYIIFFIIALSCIHPLYAQERPIIDTAVYEYVNLFSKEDTSFFKSYFLNDSLLVRKEYYGKAWDAKSLTASGRDTFIVGKSNWKKIFNGKSYSFLSVNDFTNKKALKEYTRSQSSLYSYNVYTPVAHALSH